MCQMYKKKKKKFIRAVGFPFFWGRLVTSNSKCKSACIIHFGWEKENGLFSYFPLAISKWDGREVHRSTKTLLAQSYVWRKKRQKKVEEWAAVSGSGSVWKGRAPIGKGLVFSAKTGRVHSESRHWNVPDFSHESVRGRGFRTVPPRGPRLCPCPTGAARPSPSLLGVHRVS